MSRITTAVVLSDLHLGRDIGYLCSRDPKFQKNGAALVDLLQRLGPQDELILNGDFLELSLVGLDEVYRDVNAFFVLVAEAGPPKRIVYVPGNHDHHFWRSLVEDVYVDGKISQGADPPGDDLFPYCFVDERFSTRDRNLPCKVVLADLWPKDQEAPEFVVKYPHHLVRVVSDGGQEGCYLITHGHFLEDLFKPANYLIEPAHLEELEAFNSIWLEAFDYHLGHAGRLSEKARDVANAYEKGGEEARKKVKGMLDEVYGNICGKLSCRWPKTWLLKWGLNVLAKKVPVEKKSGLFGVSVDEELIHRIEDYIKNYILERYQQGKAEKYHFPCDADIPTPFTFVFGHTHRPIREKVKPLARVRGMELPLVNTGGWLRTDGPKGEGENAGVLVIDNEGCRWETLEGKLE